MKTPWAILLTKFSDDASEPYDRARYEEIFTSAGAGKWNMVDYFRDISHGRVDLSGSRVFGWNTLDKKHSDYVGSGANQAGRAELVQWARQAAIDAGDNLDGYFCVVVVMNVTTDLFGGPDGVVTFDDGRRLSASNLSPAILGQEMGHAYLLDHSRLWGSEDDYGDTFDVMSAWATDTAPHPDYAEAMITNGEPVFQIGPTLNAANMDCIGWLDHTRVWENQSGAVNTTIKLRPLHRRDLPGYLAARFGDYYIEFRGGEAWDAGFDPAVFVHVLEDGRSYLVPDNAGNTALNVGSVISPPDDLSVLGSSTSLSVIEVDWPQRTATLHFSRVLPQIPREWPKSGPYLTPWVKWLSLIERDQPLVVVDGREIKVRPGSVEHAILRGLALYQSSELATDARLQQVIRAEALTQIGSVAATEVDRKQFRSPAMEQRLRRHRQR